MRILVIDNHDSFVFNLVHYLEGFGHEITVKRPIQIEEIKIHNFDKILLSPGPGLPEQSGELMKAIDLWHQKKPILGVCLGHQALAIYFGAELENLATVTHGVTSRIYTTEHSKVLFSNLPKNLDVGRYHSWVVKSKTLPNQLLCTATDKTGLVMAFRHQSLPIYGIQFHPESILTSKGHTIIENWLKS